MAKWNKGTQCLFLQDSGVAKKDETGFIWATTADNLVVYHRPNPKVEDGELVTVALATAEQFVKTRTGRPVKDFAKFQAFLDNAAKAAGADDSAGAVVVPVPAV